MMNTVTARPTQAAARSISSHNRPCKSPRLAVARSASSKSIANQNSFVGQSLCSSAKINASHAKARGRFEVQALESYEDPEVSISTDDGPCLVLMRHGESMWNSRNLFTGCVDVPLTQSGVEEALKAGRRISNVPVDVIFVSELVRAQMTALIAMTQHKLNKVPILLHEEDERAKSFSKIFSDNTLKDTIPVIKAFDLNERMYGDLQGLNKQETAERYGTEQVMLWRRSYDVPPPSGESLEMTAARSVKYFKEHVEPLLKQGKNVLISAHGNSLRAIIMYLENLTPEEVVLLELFTAIPMVYEYGNGRYISRGAPQDENTLGVYAISPGLARYKNVLETTNKGTGTYSS